MPDLSKETISLLFYMENCIFKLILRMYFMRLHESILFMDLKYTHGSATETSSAG